MAKISKAELKRALIAAEKKRLEHSINLGPDPAVAPELLSSQRAGEKLLVEFFRKAGLDVDQLSSLQKQHDAELQRLLDKQKTDAVARASREMDTVYSSISGQSEVVQKVTVNQGGIFNYPSFSLDRPFLIWATPHSNIISDSAIESFNSWAKINVDSTQSSGREKLSFYFMWDNPSDFYAVINATAAMSATGHLRATAQGGLSGVDPTSRYSNLSVMTSFALWEWWKQPPTSTPYSTQLLKFITVSASFWTKSVVASVSDGSNLDRTSFIVPPRGVVVLEAAFEVVYSNGHGHVIADFESGAFKIACPVAVVSVLSSPSVLVASSLP